jgi:hypothetical protein
MIVSSFARRLLPCSYGLVATPMCYRAGRAGAASQAWRAVSLLISMITKTFLCYVV